MPTYTYYCDNCHIKFELFFFIKDYIENPKCESCKKKNVRRLYCDDVLTQSASVKKSDSELKTIGDLARRNTDKMSEDEKNALYMKHNNYKNNKEAIKPLPTGMKRMKKPPKIKWPGSIKRNKRKPK